MAKEMMDLLWTPETLSDTLWALNRLVGLAPPERLSAAAREHAGQVRAWIRQVEPLAVAGAGTVHVPAFPLNHSELIDLQDQVLAAIGQSSLRHGIWAKLLGARRLGSPLARALFPLEHLEARLHHAQFSSWLIAIGIMVLAGVNVLDLLVLDLSKITVLLVNLAATAVVLAVWGYHHSHFIAHEWDVITEHIAPHLHWHNHQPPAGAA